MSTRRSIRGNMVRFAVVAVLLALFGLGSPTRAHANPALSFSWDGCEGPIHRTPSGPGVYSLYATVTGMVPVHWAWEARLHYATPKGDVPDAWRFDQSRDACHPTSLAAFSDAPTAREVAACPALHGKAQFLTIHAIRRRIDGDPTSVGENDDVLLYAQAYKQGIECDPDKRYFLFRVDFDHSASVKGATADSSCGGFEQDIVFQPVAENCNYLIMDDKGERQALPFDLPAAPLTFGSTAMASKWGRIKSQLPR